MPKKIDLVELKKNRCRNVQITVGKNDFTTTHPELVKEFHPTKNGDMKMHELSFGMSTPVWWLCSEGHEYQATPNHRSCGTNCPYCSGNKVLPGFNDLLTINPDLAMEWHPTKNIGLLNNKGEDISLPSKVGAGSTYKVWWIGKCGHQWDATIRDRNRGSGCPYCTNRKVLVGFNDLAFKYPDIAKQWHPTKNGNLRPTDVVYSSHQKAWWQCEHGHEWEAKIENRVFNNTNCPYCSGRYVVSGKTDLQTKYPNIAAEWHSTKNGKLHPCDVTSSSNKKVWWICSNGHEWEAKINNRTSTGNTGCPYCAGQKVWQGFNDLATKHPELANEWHPIKNGNLRPNQVTRRSGQKVWWLGKCGHEWDAIVSNRVAGQNCPICNRSHGEIAVLNILISSGCSFKEQNIFNDRKSSFGGTLRDDFAILKNDNVVATIEYHGLQHYEPVDFAGKGKDWAKKHFRQTQARDAAKTKYLQEHNIPQLIIPYWEYDNISTLVQNFISTL